MYAAATTAVETFHFPSLLIQDSFGGLIAEQRNDAASGNMVIKKLVKGGLASLGLELRRTREEQIRWNWLRESSASTVLDVGANIGEFAEKIRSVLPEAFIYSFEPLQDCFERLNKRMKGDSRFRSFNFALDQESGMVPFNRNSFHQSSSLLPMEELHKKEFPASAKEVSEEVAAYALDEVCASIALGDGIFLKLDVQGAEGRVLMGARETLRRVDVVMIETSFVRFYRDQILFPQVFEMLTAEGFDYNGCMGALRSKRDGFTLSEDSLFIRPEFLEARVV